MAEFGLLTIKTHKSMLSGSHVYQKRTKQHKQKLTFVFRCVLKGNFANFRPALYHQNVFASFGGFSPINERGGLWVQGQTGRGVRRRSFAHATHIVVIQSWLRIGKVSLSALFVCLKWSFIMNYHLPTLTVIWCIVKHSLSHALRLALRVLHWLMHSSNIVRLTLERLEK